MSYGFRCGDRCRAFTVIEGEYEIVDETPPRYLHPVPRIARSPLSCCLPFARRRNRSGRNPLPMCLASAPSSGKPR